MTAPPSAAFSAAHLAGGIGPAVELFRTVTRLQLEAAARPWLPWILALTLTAVWLTLRLSVDVLRGTLPLEPNAGGLHALVAGCAACTVPLFRWPRVIPEPVLRAAVAYAALTVHYTVALTHATLGPGPAAAAGAVNVPLLAWIASHLLPASGGPSGLRLPVHRLFAVVLPACLLPQVVVLAALWALCGSAAPPV